MCVRLSSICAFLALQGFKTDLRGLKISPNNMFLFSIFAQKVGEGGHGPTRPPPLSYGPVIHNEGNFYLTREVTGDKNIRKIRHSVKAKYNWTYQELEFAFLALLSGFCYVGSLLIHQDDLTPHLKILLCL